MTQCNMLWQQIDCQDLFRCTHFDKNILVFYDIEIIRRVKRENLYSDLVREGSTKTIEFSVLYALTSRVLFIHYAAFVVTFSCKKICWPLFWYLIEITFLEDHQPMCRRSVNSTMYMDLKCYHKSRL